MKVSGLVRSFSKSLVLGLCGAGAMMACHAPERMMVGSHSVDPKTYTESHATVQREFLAMTSCPKAQQTVTILAVQQEEVTELGVSGCNQKRAFIRLREKESSWGNVRHWSANWTLQTKSNGEPASF